jgi:hypothetical protein
VFAKGSGASGKVPGLQDAKPLGSTVALGTRRRVVSKVNAALTLTTDP